MGRVINVLAALLVSAAVLALFAVGYGPVPALGRALVPGHGAWASARGGQPIHSQTLSLPGLAHPVSVAFTSHGVASVRAADEADAYLALGYLHARFRLTEMDLERRLGEGRIAQLAGPAGLLIGQVRAAPRPAPHRPGRMGRHPPHQPRGPGAHRLLPRRQRLPRPGPPHRPMALPLRPGRRLPGPLDPRGQPRPPGRPDPGARLHHHPLDYAILERTLGPARTMAWFPILAARPAAPPTTPARTSTAASPHSPPSGPGADTWQQRQQRSGRQRAAAAAGGKGAGAGPAARVASPRNHPPHAPRPHGGHHRRRRQRAEAPVSGPAPAAARYRHEQRPRRRPCWPRPTRSPRPDP